MNKTLLATLTLVVTLSACGVMRESRLNPFNWFGRDREARVATEVQVGDPRPLVAEIVSLKIDKMPGGAIISAVGLPQTQGHWEAALVPVGGREIADKGTLRYEFRLLPPLERRREGTQRSREVLVGHFLSDQKLAEVRVIEVIAAVNRRSVRR